ncbi:hypothetical protein ACFLUT_03360 [Chloroflexota bacterium]
MSPKPLPIMFQMVSAAAPVLLKRSSTGREITPLDLSDTYRRVVLYQLLAEERLLYSPVTMAETLRASDSA